MNPSEEMLGYQGRSAGRDLALLASDLLPPLDVVCVVLAAALSSVLYYSHGPAAHPLNSEFTHAPWVAAVLAPFILYDKDFGAVAIRGTLQHWLRPFALRFCVFTLLILTLGLVTQTLEHFPPGWLTLWFVSSLTLTVFSRALMAKAVRTLQRHGAISEVVAIVGAGPLADRLVAALALNRGDNVELLGVFDDRFARTNPDCILPVGNLTQLIELGKTRKIDWILLALPPTAEQRLTGIVQRLMALSVPVGLVPQHIGSTLPYRRVDYTGNGLPINLLADRPIKRWDALAKSAEDLLPRWTITSALLPVTALRALKQTLARPRGPQSGFVHHFDDYDLPRFTALASRFGQERYGYVVTPNADHIIRLHESPSFRSLYASADYVLLDSRFLSHVLRMTKGIELRVCTGSDLTANLFASVIRPNDPLVLIGATPRQAQQLRARYGLQRLEHFDPPMGFINDPDAVETCLRFIETRSPFRFCILAVGSPQQEMLARQLKARGVARGLALCVGASVNFLTGDERRAPRWMQRCGAEWAYRLMQSPGRMAQRYLVRGPRVFGLLRRARIVVRPTAPPVLQIVQSHAPVTLAQWPKAARDNDDTLRRISVTN